MTTPFKLSEITFRLVDPETIRNFAVVKIVTPELYDKDGFPVEGGLMDPRMGVIDPGLRCRTCGKRFGECPGHFGYIELARPVIHVLYAELIYDILRIVCHNCGRIKLPEEKIKRYLKRFEYLKKVYGPVTAFQQLRKKLLEETKNVTKCPHCGYENPKVEFQKPYKFFIYEKEGKRRLTPIEIREILEKIPDDHARALGFGKDVRPEWMVLTVLPVPPPTVRPSIILETGERAEDDLTHKLADIVRTNLKLQEAIATGAPEIIVEDLWDLLQYHVATYFYNNLPNVPKARHRSGRPLKSLVERISGKEGRLRYNLLGKRVDFSARAVISPDPRIEIDEVGVPIEVAMELTVPERVTEWNIEWLRKLVLNGPNKYPGANYVIRPDGKRFRITDENKEMLANELQPGWIVERHLMDGDIVLFNRYPSVHRMNMMAHRVRVLPGRTFRINPFICTPYYADFDGDEMNIHVPQTEEARTEARLLMNPRYHIVSPRYGLAIVGLIQDAISGLYLLTQDDTKLSFDEAAQLLYDAGIPLDKFKRLMEKAKKEGRDYLTGKEVFSCVLPDDLNFEYEAKGIRFVIENGMLKEGVVTKDIVGAEKGHLIRYVYEKYGPDFTIKFIHQLGLLGIEYQWKHGLSLSLSEWDLPKEAEEEIKRIKEEARKEIEKLIEKYRKGEITPMPGKTVKETFETMVLQVLNKVRDEVGKIVEKYLKKNTNTFIMLKSGARGNILNIAQMVGVVGQQALRGQRIEFGYKDRNLPIFKKGDLSPEAKGWIDVGYRHGLRPWEFFFQSMVGRDALMDTAVRTAYSGYLYRRLVNATYDVKVWYDGTVRDSWNRLIQFLYGEDGLDVQKTEKGKLNIDRIIKEVLKEYQQKK